ncbi:TNF receptor-associated factor 1-like isoform X2 [Emydura macquarii macquarii]|uniref:TNF receptor-associated factor 1-like isoform X2 n=1 Tax=Emydura macquarii macquarii TaxID=1129001 RepID=UPI00352A9B54
MSLIIVSPWGSTKPILAPSPPPQGEGEGYPGGHPLGGPSPHEGAALCDWDPLQPAEDGHGPDCGYHRCTECEPGTGRAGGPGCPQCFGDQGKRRLNDLDGVQRGKAEDPEALGPPSQQRLLLEAARGAREARGRLDQVEAQQQTLQNIVAVLSRELGRRELGVGSADVLGEAMARILYLEEKVAQQDSLLALKDVMISSLGARIQALEQTSYDGRFLWRVPDVGRRMQQALSGQTPAIHSPSFYTSRYGYRLCLKLYFNGDGTGAGTHISLFLVVMRGEYDFQLKWPFRHKVTFTLLDQIGERHVSASFRPPDSSSSFQRPVSETNVASGLPEFFPLRQLQAPEATYIHEDTLALQALIDMGA